MFGIKDDCVKRQCVKSRLESFPVSRFFGFLATNQNTIVLRFEEA